MEHFSRHPACPDVIGDVSQSGRNPARGADWRLKTEDYLTFNIAYGGNTTLNKLFMALRDNLAKFDEKIVDIKPERCPNEPE